MEKNQKEKPKKSRKAKNNKKESTNEIFDFNEEIVIGINSPKKLENKPKKNKNKNKKKKKNMSKENKRESKLNFFIKWTILIILLIGSIIYFLMSPLFNISHIEVSGNSKISKEEIISLSRIEKGENTYKISKSSTIQKIKENPYIDTVQIKRILPDGISIEVTEREAKYMIEYGNAYVYLDNQGYILELAEEALDGIIITGYSTPTDDLKPCNRLVVDDLKKLEKVIELVSAAQNNDVLDQIIKIDIEDSDNYKLIMEDNKIAYTGSLTNLNVKMLYLKEVLEREQGKEGEIFLEGESNKNNVVFREKI